MKLFHQQPERSKDAAQVLSDDLDADHTAKQTPARTLTPEMEALLNQLIRGNRSTIRRRWTIYVVGSIVGASLGVVAQEAIRNAFGYSLPTVVGSWLSIVAAMLVSICLALSRTQKEAAKKLARYDDMRLLGPMLDLLPHALGSVRKCVIAVLTRLLPRIPATGSADISPERRSILLTALNPWNAHKQADFLIAVLKALEQVGNADSLPSIRRLSRMKPTTTERARVIMAAKACLEHIQDAIEPDRKTKRLLRAAQPPDSPEEVLLRPVHAEPSDATDMLLRPAQADTLTNRLDSQA